MTRLLTEAQAWTEIARRFEQEAPQYGLCMEITELEYRRISRRVANQMNVRVQIFCPDKNPDTARFFWPYRSRCGWDYKMILDESDDCRVIAAGLLAAMAADRDPIPKENS